MSYNLAYRGPAKTEQEILNRLDVPPSLIAIDTETISLDDTSCIGIGISFREDESFYIQVLPNPSPLLLKVMEILSELHIVKVYHNAIFDLTVLSNLARQHDYKEPDIFNIQDTMLMAKNQGYEGELFGLGIDLLGYWNNYDIKTLLETYAPKKGRNMLHVPWDKVAEKCMNDTHTTYRIYHKLINWPNHKCHDCYEVDKRLLPLLLDISKKGLALNQDALEAHRKRLTIEVQKYKEECDELNFNPASPQQVGYVLASRGNTLPFTDKTLRKYRTNEDALLSIDDPLAEVILGFRGANKLLSTYVKPSLGANRQYTHLRLDLATGRFASAGYKSHEHVCTNQQNIPPNMRDIYEPDSNIFTNADYSQIEYRVFGYLAKDPVIMQTYAEGGDIHWSTQQVIHPGSDRKDEVARLNAKTFNFTTIFFGTLETLSRQTGIDITTCTSLVNDLHDRYSVAFQWAAEQRAIEVPWVETDAGRRCRLPDPVIFPQEHIDKCKVSYQVQGTAADIVKRAMLELANMGVDLRLQVHDEFLIDNYVEIPESLSHIHPELITPLETKWSAIWK